MVTRYCSGHTVYFTYSDLRDNCRGAERTRELMQQMQQTSKTVLNHVSCCDYSMQWLLVNGKAVQYPLN